MNKFIKLCVCLVLAGFVSSAQAFYSPVAIGIVPPLQFPGKDFSITGLRASLGWGNQRDIYGLDLGLIGNITQQDFYGAALAGGFNYTKGQTRAILQAAGFANINQSKTNIVGAQIAIGMNQNIGDSSVAGLQLALANLSQHTTIMGAQVGVYNVAQKVYGIQLGLVNVAESLSGIQIGLVNFHRKGLFTVSPFINIGF